MKKYLSKPGQKPYFHEVFVTFSLPPPLCTIQRSFGGWLLFD